VVSFLFQKILGRLSFSKILVVFHICSSYNKAAYQKSASKVAWNGSKCNETRVVVVVVFLTDNNTTPTKVVLSCFGLLVGLWQ
jgi:hypothetical protein